MTAEELAEIVAVVAAAAAALDGEAQPDVPVRPPPSRWRAAGRTYDAYDAAPRPRRARGNSA